MQAHRTPNEPRALASWVLLAAACVAAPLAAAEPLAPRDALKSFRVADGLRIDLVAAEPQVVDPVAIAFDEQGRLFVVEMRDYPNGPAQGKPPQSRVKLLEDRDGDGYYETSQVFADGLPFANGVMCWNGGVIVTAAPDIVYLRDSDGDGKADVREKLFTGFTEGNPQLRVNHPTLGIDNWIYVANGLSGGRVRRPGEAESAALPISQMDFRFRPDRSAYEATAGNAQFGLTFDDYANRFLCSNRRHAAHVVLPDRYLKRNPYLAVPTTVVDIPDHGAAARVFPLTAARTTAVEHAGSFTAACGVTVYRGGALGEAYRGNLFVCEPTGNLVHRDVLVPSGDTFVARRAPEEARREFLAATDEWFRPVNLANGPDGALYIVDMYRETIEHPQYMPKGLAETLDLKKGNDRGRIYRVVSSAHASGGTRPVLPGPASSRELVERLAAPDSWPRETAQRLLVERRDASVAALLRDRALRCPEPLGRLHALWTLDGIGALDDATVLAALGDSDSRLREHAVCLAEPRLAGADELRDRVVALAADPAPRVRFQVALSLGDLADPPVVEALRAIAVRDADDPWTSIAVLSSAPGRAVELWERLARHADFTREPTAGKSAIFTRLAAVIAARGEDDELARFLRRFAPSGRRATERAAADWWQLAALTGLADGLTRSHKTLGGVLDAADERERPAANRIRAMLDDAGQIARDDERPVPARVAAIKLLAHRPLGDVAELFRALLQPQQAPDVQIAAARALAPSSDPAVAELLLQGWSGHSPPLRREVLEAVFARRERLPPLLDAIEAGTIKPAELDTQRHTQLLNYPVADVKERARRLFETQGTPNRKEVIESFRPVLAQSGDLERGKAVFRKNCATCHRIAGEGHRVGPELTGLRTRNKEALLMDILDPNRALEPNYANYIIALKDGRTLNGIIASETATTVTVRRAEEAEDTLLRRDIDIIQATGQSLMPEGLERNVSQAEMVDLIEYLQTVP